MDNPLREPGARTPRRPPPAMTKTSPQSRIRATNTASFVFLDAETNPLGGIGPTSRGFAFVDQNLKQHLSGDCSRSPMDRKRQPSTFLVVTTTPSIDLRGAAEPAGDIDPWRIPGGGRRSVSTRHEAVRRSVRRHQRSEFRVRGDDVRQSGLPSARRRHTRLCS
jgi:hypothetical protein